MKTIRFAALALAATFISAPAFAQDALGTWDTAIDMQGTTIEAQLTISEGDDGFTVDIVDGPMPGAPADAAAMPSEISEVMVEGDGFSFKRALTTPQGAMTLSYSGTIEGDALTGEIQSDFGPIPLSGTRASGE